MRPRFRLVPTLATLVGLAILATLASWQFSRYQEKLARESAHEDQADKAPKSIHSLEQLDLEADAFRSLKVEGRLATEWSILFKHRSRERKPGYWLGSPLILRDGQSALFVNRGWIPMKDGPALADELRQAPEAKTYRGVLHVPRRVLADQDARSKLQGESDPLRDTLVEWRTYDIDGVTDAIPLRFPEKAAVLVLTEPESEHEFPIASADHVTRPYLTSDRHLGYAAFWSVTALALLGLYLAASFGLVGSVRYRASERSSDSA